MRKKMLFVLFSVIVILAVAVSPVGAVTDGELDGEGHPYVGLMVAQDEDGNPLWRCSGTLISPTIFLTAGHCTEDPAEHVEIWFDADVTNAALHDYPFNGDVGGTPYTHPDYDPNAFFLFDLGVVVLDEPVYMDEYGVLPTLNQLDQYATQRGQNKLTFTSVGYGLQESFPDAAAWKNEAVRIRLVAYPRLIQINKGFLTVGDMSILVSNNANTGGLCFGDSGGPLFLEDTNLIVGVNSYVLNNGCAGTGGIYRIDQEDDLRWLYENFGQYM